MEVGTMETISYYPNVYEWTIPEFFSTPLQVPYIKSPEFIFFPFRYILRVSESTPGIMTISLRNVFSDSQCISIHEYITGWELEIRQANEEVLLKSSGFREYEHEMDIIMYVPFNEIERRCPVNGFFKVRCILDCVDPCVDAYYEVPIKEVQIENKTKKVPSVEKLSSDLEVLLNRKDRSDVTIRVEGREFKAHKAILAVRSPVFASMFKHEMSESITGVVDIDDCDAITFRKFLRYLYSGRVPKFSPDTVFSFHKIADKYQVNELKAFCLEFIKNNLTVDKICDAIKLCLYHDEEDSLLKLLMELLIEKVVKFLSENMEKIKSTKKWKKFESEYPSESDKFVQKVLEMPKPRFAREIRDTSSNNSFIQKIVGKVRNKK